MPKLMKKTPTMLLIEAKDQKKRTIEEIMRDAYQAHGNYRAAAKSIGITHAAFSQWAVRLNLELATSA